jgi:hypothetical protein
MHIEAELDDIHSARLILLQQRLQKPLPEVLATVIDWAINYQSTASTIPSACSEEERLAALAHLDTISIDWGGKPIENRNALYDDARGY